MQQNQSQKGRENSSVKIEFTSKLLTSWGGTSSIISRFLSKIEFRTWVEKSVPASESSNNSTGVYSKILSLFLTVLNGGDRFAHMNYWGDSLEVFQKCFQVDRLPKSSTSLTRFWNKFNSQAINEEYLQKTIQFSQMILKQSQITSDSLRFDSSVVTRYGNQDGVKRGYNPTKRGRPSYQPQIAFLGSGFIVNLWNRSGNITSGNGIIDYFKQTTAMISNINIERVLADNGYYLVEFINYLEDNGYEYVISAPIIPILQKKIYQLTNWKTVDYGIEVTEFKFQHKSPKWDKDRRYIVVRQEIKKRPNATGKQLTLFKELDNITHYRHTLLITNNTEDSPHTIWNYYKPRANDENVIKDLKDGYGFAAFSMHDFWATEAVLITLSLIFHNLIMYLMMFVISPQTPRKQLKTFRMSYLLVPGMLGRDGRNSVLRLGVRSRKRRQIISNFLEKIRNIKLNFRLQCS